MNSYTRHILAFVSVCFVAGCNAAVSPQANDSAPVGAFPADHKCAAWAALEGPSPFWQAATTATVRECLAVAPGWLSETNRYGFTPLHFAARDSDARVVAELVRLGAPIDWRDKSRFTPLRNAARYNSAETVRILLDAGADPNERYRDRWGPIHFAVRYNSIEVIQTLLDAGADPNSRKSIRPYTSLELAKHIGREPAVIELLQRAEEG